MAGNTASVSGQEESGCALPVSLQAVHCSVARLPIQCQPGSSKQAGEDQQRPNELGPGHEHPVPHQVFGGLLPDGRSCPGGCDAGPAGRRVACSVVAAGNALQKELPVLPVILLQALQSGCVLQTILADLCLMQLQVQTGFHFHRDCTSLLAAR